jgi:hypothetical protein
MLDDSVAESSDQIGQKSTILIKENLIPFFDPAFHLALPFHKKHPHPR